MASYEQEHGNDLPFLWLGFECTKRPAWNAKHNGTGVFCCHLISLLHYPCHYFYGPFVLHLSFFSLFFFSSSLFYHSSDDDIPFVCCIFSILPCYYGVYLKCHFIFGLSFHHFGHIFVKWRELKWKKTWNQINKSLNESPKKKLFLFTRSTISSILLSTILWLCVVIIFGFVIHDHLFKYPIICWQWHFTSLVTLHNFPKLFCSHCLCDFWPFLSPHPQHSASPLLIWCFCLSDDFS